MALERKTFGLFNEKGILCSTAKGVVISCQLGGTVISLTDTGSMIDDDGERLTIIYTKAFYNLAPGHSILEVEENALSYPGAA